MSEMTRARATARIAWLFGLPLAALVLIAWSSMALVSRELASARAAQAEVLRTREVLSELQAVLSLLQDAQTGERGYIITNQDRFLQPFETAEHALPARLGKLATLLAGTSDEAKAKHLVAGARAQMAFLGQVVELQRRGDSSKALELVRTQRGKVLMDEIRSDVQSLEQDQQRLLSQRIQAFTASSLRSERTVTLALLAAVLLVAGAGGLLFRYAQRRLRAELAADQASQLLRSTMDNINEGVVVYDQDMCVVGWNARFLELRRLDPAKMHIGMTAHELMQLAEPMTIKIAGNVYDSRAAAPGFGNAKAPFDGEAISLGGLVLRIWGRPIAYGNYIVTVSDVTALRNSEAAYRDRAARLNSTLDNVVDAIITINESGSIESWSKGAERLFGYATDEVLQRNIYKLMPDPHAGARGGYLHDDGNGDRRVTGRRQQVEAVHKDGRRIPVDLGINEMRIDNRRLFVGIVRDISERLEIDRMKSGFVSTVSHELRTPLTSIGGSLGLLAGGAAGPLSSKAARLIDIAKQNSDRLVRLINDILDLEKVESGKLELRLEQQPLTPIVEQAIELNRGYAEGFGVAIQLEAHDIDGDVLVDRDRFIQVLTNLLSNAVKYSPREGVVRVAVRSVDNTMQVSVRDEGLGIPPEFEKRIFQKFSQADSSDTRAKGGTGLGLSIAKTFVERFGGTIDFVRGLAKGANFVVTLPAVVGAAPVPAPESTTMPAPHILICEDDPDIAEVLSATLHNAGMRVDTADSADLARAAIQEDRFDLVLMDVHLPDANGLDVVGEIRSDESSRTLPVIVMTAGCSDARNSDEVEALKLADWLQKPIGPERLVAAIRAALATQENNRFRVLHVEDDPSLTELVRTVLEGPVRVVAAHSLAAARALLAQEAFDLVILDIALGDGSGLDLLPLLQSSEQPPAVLVYTASEPSPEVVASVDAVIVKSRHSVAEFIASVGDVSKARSRKNLSAA